MKRNIVLFLIVGLMLTFTNANAAVSIKLGDYVILGHYNGQPIVWRCVNIDSNGPLMLSDRILTIKPYDVPGPHTNSTSDRVTKFGAGFWETSNIRSWLNSTASEVNWLCGNPPVADAQGQYWNGENGYAHEEGFLSKGNFTSSERNAIKMVTQKSLLNQYDNSDLITSGTAAHTYAAGDNQITNIVRNYDNAFAHNVTDKVFLLDVMQLYRVYQNRNTLGENYWIGKPTQQAVDNSEYKTERLNADSYWFSWLRSPVGTDGPEYARYIHYWDGGHNVAYNPVYYSDIGVRPAFYLNTASSSSKSGNGSVDNPYVVDGGSAPYDLDLQITGHSFLVDSVYETGTINFSVDVINNTPSEANAMLTCAVFDQNKKLISASQSSNIIDGDDTIALAQNITVDVQDIEGYYLKVMSWGIDEELLPLAAADSLYYELPVFPGKTREELKEEMDEYIDRDKYTAATFESYKTVLTECERVYEDDDATAWQRYVAWEALINAKKALKENPGTNWIATFSSNEGTITAPGGPSGTQYSLYNDWKRFDGHSTSNPSLNLTPNIENLRLQLKVSFTKEGSASLPSDSVLFGSGFIKLRSPDGPSDENPATHERNCEWSISSLGFNSTKEHEVSLKLTDAVNGKNNNNPPTVTGIDWSAVDRFLMRIDGVTNYARDGLGVFTMTVRDVRIVDLTPVIEVKGEIQAELSKTVGTNGCEPQLVEAYNAARLIAASIIKDNNEMMSLYDYNKALETLKTAYAALTAN